jgi:FkbM family methyltransferase
MAHEERDERLRSATTRERLGVALQHAAASNRRGLVPRRQLRRLRVAAAALASAEVTCTIFTGQRIRLVIPEIVGAQIYCEGVIEPSISSVMLDYLRPGMVFFDVGAQYGYHSLVAALLVEPEGTVVAFEPAHHAFGLLGRNLAPAPGTIAENVAVGACSGTVDFRDFGDRHSAVNTTLSAARIPAHERASLRAREYPVRMTTIDEYVAARGLVPDFVKLDAEGSEYAIVRGMQAVLHDASPILSLETGDYDGMESPGTVTTIRELDRAGYRCFEYRGSLRPHEIRDRYGYDNLFFSKEDL